MKPGSVIVDLAAEAGGNVATTVPGQLVKVHDVTHIGMLMCTLSFSQCYILYISSCCLDILTITLYLQCVVWCGILIYLFEIKQKV